MKKLYGNENLIVYRGDEEFEEDSSNIFGALVAPIAGYFGYQAGQTVSGGGSGSGGSNKPPDVTPTNESLGISTITTPPTAPGKWADKWKDNAMEVVKRKKRKKKKKTIIIGAFLIIGGIATYYYLKNKK